MSTPSNAIPIFNPRTGERDGEIVPPSAAEITQIARDLRAGQVAWEALGLDGRIAAMRRWADAIEANAAQISAAEMRDTGRKRVAHEVPFIVAGSIRGWCARAPKVVERAYFEGTSTVMPSVSYRTQLVPYPLVGIISPWNHPFLLSMLDAVPALIAGCALLVKPSEVTPRFVEPVTETIATVPELAAVLRYIVGDGGTGQALIEQVDALCFTGSVPTGRKVAEACARRFIPSFLELGGKDAVVVTGSADIQQAAAAVLKGAVSNTGQMCFATERAYVAREIYAPFVEELKAQASAIALSYPDMSQGHLGPYILARQADIVDAQLQEAVDAGATIEIGGQSQTLGGGRFMPATVVTGVDHSMRLMRDETFGPVIPVMPYDSVDEAVALANDSEFGLSGAVIAGDADEAEHIAERLNAGAISIQDTSLTLYIMGDVEKTSFGISGLGGSRMGPNAMLRFFRKKALIRRSGPVLDMESLAEHHVSSHH
ncbi:aldehyde dehydrogenase [Sphingobium chungbukense]|uniref:Aldehyde dehydrogenase n=2 Tax=Sphingobium chungbukense TaxID=56193 RepID=A0A0M3AS27_9SPHN|nr:aldehyde dehydrogenase [Sphingobium chungbukense]